MLRPRNYLSGKTNWWTNKPKCRNSKSKNLNMRCFPKKQKKKKCQKKSELALTSWSSIVWGLIFEQFLPIWDKKEEKKWEKEQENIFIRRLFARNISKNGWHPHTPMLESLKNLNKKYISFNIPEKNSFWMLLRIAIRWNRKRTLSVCLWSIQRKESFCTPSQGWRPKNTPRQLQTSK